MQIRLRNSTIYLLTELANYQISFFQYLCSSPSADNNNKNRKITTKMCVCMCP